MKGKYHYPGLKYVGKTGEKCLLEAFGPTKVAIYGTGQRGGDVYADLKNNHPSLKPVFFVDTHKEGEVFGLPVINLDTLRDRVEDVDMVIIASHWHEEISRSLDSIGCHAYITALPEEALKLMELIHTLYPSDYKRVVNAIEPTDSGFVANIVHADAPDSQFELNIAQLRDTPGRMAHDLDVGTTLIYSEKPNGDPLVTLQFTNTPVNPVYSVDTMTQCDWTEDEERYVRERWGDVLKEKTQFAQAQALGRLLIEEFEPNRALPKDPYAAPMDLYKKMVAGEETVHCGVMAKIFCYMCNVLGIKCRILQLGDQSAIHPSLSLSTCHWINEVYCQQLQQWCLIDLTSYAVGFYLSGDNVLSLYEMLWFYSSNKKANVHIEKHLPDGVDSEANNVRIEARYGAINQRFSIVAPPYGG